MQSIQFLNEGLVSYLLVSCNGVMKESYETHLLQIQKVPYFLQYEIREFNGKKVLYYPLRYHTSIKTIMEHLPFTEFQIKNMLRSIIHVIQTTDEYLLHFEKIVWKTEQVFMEVDTGNLEFCYNPMEKQDNGSLKDFLSEVMSVTGKKNQDSFLLLLEFYNLVTSPNYTMEQLLEYEKDRLEENAVWNNLGKETTFSFNESMEKEQKPEEEKGIKKNQKSEKVFVRIVRSILIAVALVNLVLIAGMLCNLLTYHYIRYLMVGMVVMIVVTILYMNVDKEDSADEIMQEYFANEQNHEPAGGRKHEPVNGKNPELHNGGIHEADYNETTVLTAENDNRVFCLMPVKKEQFPPIYVREESVVVGCWEKGCDFVIARKGISRMHFKLIKREKEMYVMDLNSTNGTCLNGERLEGGKEYKVEEGDVIAFARLEFFVVLE